MAEGKPKMISLTGNNYAIWKTKILDKLYVKNLAKPIAHKGIEPDDYVLDWEELDRRCLGFIRDYIDSSVIHHVEKEESAYAC